MGSNIFLEYVIESEKTADFMQNMKGKNLWRSSVTGVISTFCGLFQVHSVLHYVARRANAKVCLQMQNEINVSKGELLEEKLNFCILT